MRKPSIAAALEALLATSGLAGTAKHGAPAKKNPTPKKGERPKCGARTRNGGTCQARVAILAGGKIAPRCALHGGASTGPRSEAGRLAIIESNRRRAGERRQGHQKPPE